MESFFHTGMLLNANWVWMLLALLLQYHKLNDRKIMTIPDTEIFSYEGCKNCLFAKKPLANRIAFIGCWVGSKGRNFSHKVEEKIHTA
jgi:hypothetical protein